jgi:pyruvate dehydrogenase E2 component (dihydrolipoamide acetyltransferase)
MPTEITMPQLSDTMSEGTVVKWHLKEGDPVKAGQEIADIETDKATMPMESFDAGALAFIAAPEGAKVKVGSLLAVIAKPNENPTEIKNRYAATPHNIEPGAPELEPRETHPREELLAPPRKNGHPDRLRISPLAARVATEKGVDLSQIRGSGPAGRIIQRDILALLPPPPPPPPP